MATHFSAIRMLLIVQLNKEVMEGTVWVRNKGRNIHVNTAPSDAYFDCDTCHRDMEVVADSLVFSERGILFLISSHV